MHSGGANGGLDELRRRYPAENAALITEIAESVLSTMRGDLSACETALLAEVEQLGRTIAAAKAEIAALRVDDITGNHIPSATDELDAIVAHTARATNAILEVCETLDAVSGALARAESQADRAHAAKLQEATTTIYEACGFQDITGQRITKVVATLKTIETRVAAIVATFGGPNPPPPVPGRTPRTMLLNGPQLPAAAMAQTDIDKLLASLD
jgi:chemotaxis protein CheZ